MTIRIATITNDEKCYYVEIRDRKGKSLSTMIFQGYDRGTHMANALRMMNVTTIEPVGIHATEIMEDMQAVGFKNFI